MRLNRLAAAFACVFLLLIRGGVAAPADWSVTVPVASVFREPSAQSERVTQVLFGEPVRVIKSSGGWAQVKVLDQYRLADGYPGYVLLSALGHPSSTAPSTAVVRTARASIHAEARSDSPVLCAVFMGTSLPCDATSGDWVRVALPNRAEGGYLASSEVSVAGAHPGTGEEVVRTALQLRGTRYLWGGLSASGIDCSGLTFESYRVHGVTLPRDADQQFQTGLAVSRSQLQAGDLVFFGKVPGRVTHVGLYWKDGTFVEAAAHGVTVSPLTRRADFQGGRRVLGVKLHMPAPSP